MVLNTLVTHTPIRESHFRLKPLVATIHLLITGGLFASLVSPVYAALPEPMPGGWIKPGDGAASMNITGSTQNILNIKQETDKVILNWKSFNVGKENIVNFQQPLVTSIALNRINDQSPSHILGQINANGQVYLMNRNGFVFGKDSIINTNSLIASTLNISDNVLKQGITQVFKPGDQPDKQVAAFGDRPDESDDSTSVNKAANITFEKGLKTDDKNQLVDNKNKLILDKFNKPIVVSQGFNTNAKGQLVNATGQVVIDKQGKAIVPVPVEAKIQTAKDGQIIIVAPTIKNSGTIQAEQHGQIIMAASQDKVYLQAADESSPFAGLVVEVETGGKVTNAGDILTKEGNITMAGFAVNQEGRVSATTSVNVNGSIRLVAKEHHSTVGVSLVSDSTTRTEDKGDGLGKTSKLTFDKDSVTEIVPDADKSTAIDEQKQPLSYLEATAHSVALQAKSSIKVTGGTVNITATDTPLAPSLGTTGRVFVDKTAKIDVSGVKNVKVAMERNVADLSVQSFELRNSPEQLTGVLKGANVKVDLRDKTTIIDTTGANARVKRDINERLTAGGKINLTSSGDVIVNSGATLDISGGSVGYQGGYIKTTQLIADNGRILDISAADPVEHYTGIFGIITEHNQKFGTVDQWDVAGKGRFEKGYVDGKSAGAVNIATPKLAWAGDVTAKFVTGVNQRVPYTPTTPVGGTFTIDMALFKSPQNVRFQSSRKQLDFSNEPVNGQNPEFPKDANGVAEDLVLDSSLTSKSSIAKLSVKTWGDANLDKGLAIKMLPGSSLAIEAANITDSASIKTPGGNVTLNAIANELYPQAGKVILDTAAKVNVSGLWINDLQKGLAATPTDQLWIDGGSVKVTGQNDVVLPAGSSIVADGGAWYSSSRKLTAGKGGNISLGALGNSGTPSTLTLSGLLSAYSISKGGSLSLTTGNLVIDKLENLGKDDKGNTVVKDPSLSANTLALATKNNGFVFAPNFGFSKLTLEGNYTGVAVKENVLLDLKTKNLFLDGDFYAQATGSSIRDFSRIILLPESQRQAQELTLIGKENVVLATGSQVKLEKSSKVDVQSTGSILIDGSVNAPAGKIKLTINSDSGMEYKPGQTIWLGAHGNLMVAGTGLLDPIGVLGQQTGSILDGGDININANRGYAILEKGSQIDVSGTKGKVDIYQENANGKEGFKRTTIGSNAGSIGITAAEGIVVDGTMKGAAGTTQQAAGSLLLSLDRSKRSEPTIPKVPFPVTTLDIQLEQKDRTILANTQFGDIIPSELNGRLVVSADEITQAGFSNVQLSTLGRLIFASDLNLKTAESIKLDAPTFVWTGNEGAGGTVSIDSSYVQLGSTIVRENASLPTTGNGNFKANAKWLGLTGSSLWNNFANITLNSKHDLRTTGLRTGDQRNFIGGMVTSANLDLNASQIYPSTLTNFTFNTSGNIHITGSNTDSSPLSAGGTLKFIAANIQQDGVVKAPLGSINFSASQSLAFGNNSLSSVSGKGQVTPFGVTKGGLDWVYPLINSSLDLVDLSNQANLRNLIVDAPPQKQLVLNAPEVTLAAGSKLDIAGGGDIMATEFKPVSAEMTDLLQLGSSAYKGSFAVLPTLGSALAPNDPLLSVDWNLAAGQQVYLNGTSQLPAGKYTVLPAYYALMPGAFLITPQAHSQDSNITTYSLDGLPIVSGYQTMASTGTRDARTSGFKVQSMTEVLQQNAQYSVTCASNCADTFRDQAKTVSSLQAENINNSLALLTGKQKILTENYYQTKATAKGLEAPILPVDSGQISIISQTKLLLNGDIDFAGYGPKAKGARMDIAADNIHIVKQLSTTPVSGDLEILDTDLNKLSVDSLLLGGARTFKADGSTDVAVSSKSVTFDQGAQVKMKDLTAAANQKVEVKTDASLTATGAVNTGDTIFNIAGDGALLRVSADKQITLNRTASSGVEGDLIVASGASLKADKSILLDGSKSNILSGDINLQKGTTASPSSLNISANSINIGAVAGLADDALNISNQKLMNLAVDELVLNSRGTLSFYGNVGQVDANNNPINGGELSPIVFDKLVLNTAAFAGFGADNQAVKLQANTLELANPYASAPVISGNGTGTLDLTANQMTLGGGQVAINGFQTTKLTAQQKLLVDVSSQLQASSDVMLTAGYITATGGTDFKLDATGHNIVVSGVKEVVLPKETTGFGASMNFIADSVSFDSKAQLASGKLGLHALVKDVAVGSSAAIDLAGRKVNFADSADYTPGGQFSAIADKGAITLNTGSNLDLRSGGGSAAAGTLLLKAKTAPLKDAIGLSIDNTGSVTLSGQIQASNGNANIDVAWLNRDTSFDQLLDTLKAAGINNAVNFRSHTADIFLSSGNDFSANTITLVADQGAVNIAGQLNANGSAQGGQISIYAGDKITLASGGQLTVTGAKGGKVLLSSVDSDADKNSGIELEKASLIDVSGATANQNGSVTLRALQTDTGINIKPIEGNVVGAAKLLAEGVKQYNNDDLTQFNVDLTDDGEINAEDIAAIKAATDSYMSPKIMDDVATSLGHGAVLIPGVEINYTGDLALNARWDLVDWRYNSNPGHLVIRASGDLNLNKTLTDGFKTEKFNYVDAGVDKKTTIVDKLQTGNSWSYGLTAGADTQSADSNQTNTLGNMVIGSNVMVRNGTGDIQLNAGGDISFTKADAAVSKTLSTSANSNVLVVPNTTGWDLGAYVSGTGIASGTTIVGINDTPVVSKLVYAAKGTTVLIVPDTRNWTVGNYIAGTGLNSGIAPGTQIVSIDDSTPVVTKLVSAVNGSTLLIVPDTNNWSVGAYVAGTGIAAGSQIVSIDENTRAVSKQVSATKGSKVLIVPDTNNWSVGAYVTGTGIPVGSQIVSIDENTPVASKQVSAVNGSTILIVPDTNNWSVGAYVTGTGIPVGSQIVSIDESTTAVTKQVYAANGSSVLVVPNTSDWTVGSYVTGKDIPIGAQITAINDADVVSKTASAVSGTDMLFVPDVSNWTMGAYVAGTGIAPGSTISSINEVTAVAKTAPVALPKDSIVLPIANTTGWDVDTYVAGTGLAVGTKITAINPAVSSQIAIAAAKGATTITVAANTGLKIGSVLSGTGIAVGTKVTNIDATGTKLTISAGTSAAIAKNAKILTLPEVVLSNPTTAAITANTSLKSQSTVILSAKTTGFTNQAVKTQPTVVISQQTTAEVKPLAAQAVKTQPTVVISQPTTTVIKPSSAQAVKTQPTVVISQQTTAEVKPLAAQAVKTQPTVVISQPTIAEIKPLAAQSVKTQPTVVINQPTTADLKNVASQAVKTQSDVLLSAATTGKATNTIIKANYINGTVYNAGQATTTDPYGTLGDGAVAKFLYSEYPVNGGDLTVKAGGNINGVASGNDYNDWLLRIGDLTNNNPDNRQPVAWGVGLGIAQTLTQTYKTNTPYFQQNVGSFGGGKVEVSAAGDISDLDVAMPTTGKQVGENTAPTSGNFSGFTDSNGVTRSQVQINGGGNLLVSAGGNVQGGSYFLGKGVGTISSQGQISEGAEGNLPIFYTGDTQLNINVVSDVKIAGVFDPMIDHKSSNAARADVNFFSYSDTSAVAIRSISGDLLLAADNGNTSISSKAELAKIYPASLQATSFGGSVNLNNDITLYPASKAKLNVFAKQSITGANASDTSAVFKLGMSDADLSLFPTAANPSISVSPIMVDTAAQISPYGLDRLVHAPTPLHTGDTEPARFVTHQGDIRDISFNTPKKTVLLSGNDISNLALDVQNVNKDDVTLIEAGRDIVFPSSRDTKTGALNSANGKKLEVAGYGDMLVKAGRNIDLGSSDGLSTVGNTYNPNLSETGANVTVLTGLNGASPSYSEFIVKYEKSYGTEIKSAREAITLFMREYTGNSALTTDEANNQFKELPADQTLPVQSRLNSLLLPVLFSEIKAAGTASASDKSAGNQGGYDAINALFPGNQWQGDLSLFFSKLQTQQGGNINLLVPGGDINAGLAVSFAGEKKASELGIVALQHGAINAVLKNDFLVNKSRVFALNIGDIMIWSSEGDIDAGKGAKSAISAPKATAKLDPDTQKIRYILPPVVQGSGIRTASSTDGEKPGNVYLFAPKGVVDAGEAGIGGNNVIISAVAVLGANNIQIGGIGVGVPVASSGGLPPGLSGTSNLTAGVSQMAESSLAAKTASDTEKAAMVKDMVLGMLSVEVLGFGE